MGTVSRSGTVHASPEVVFRFLADFEAQPRWADVVRKIWFDTKSYEGVGVTFTRILKRSIDVRELEVRSIVTHWEEGGRVGWRNTYPDGRTEDLICTVKPFRGVSKLTLTSVSDHQNGSALTRIGRHLSDEIQLINALLER